MVCATIGMNAVGCDVCVDTSTFDGNVGVRLLLFDGRVLNSDPGFEFFGIVMDFVLVFTFVLVERKPKPFIFETGVGDFEIVV